MIEQILQGALRARDTWEKQPERQPRLLLSVAEIDPEERGAVVWAALTIGTAAGVPQPAMIKELCREGKMPRVALYRMMNRAMRPALELDRQILEFLGLHPCENAAELARAVARTMREAGFSASPLEAMGLWQQTYSEP